MGWVCCCFSLLLREIFSGYTGFHLPLSIQHFKIPIRPGTHGHVSTSTPVLLSIPWVNKLQYTKTSFFLKVKTRASVYDVIGDNVFHGKIMRFHLVKRSFHIYYTTWVRACSRSFFRDSAMNSYTLPSTVSFYHIFSHTVLSFTTVCALFVGITLFLSQYYLLYCEK